MMALCKVHASGFEGNFSSQFKGNTAVEWVADLTRLSGGRQKMARAECQSGMELESFFASIDCSGYLS